MRDTNTHKSRTSSKKQLARGSSGLGPDWLSGRTDLTVDRGVSVTLPAVREDDRGVLGTDPLLLHLGAAQS